MSTNRQVKLVARPKPGPFTRDIFAIENAPLAEPGAGEFRVKVEVVSLDPAMRGWVNDAKSYVAPVALGEVMRAYAAGHVDASNHPDFQVGEAVQGLFGVQQFAISNGRKRRQGRYRQGTTRALGRRSRHAGLDGLLRIA